MMPTQQSRRIMGYIYYYEVYKRTIQDENYPPPSSHAALYTSHTTPSTTARATLSTFTTPSSKSPLRNPINLLKNISDGLEALLQVNECDYLVSQQLKIDRIQHKQKVLRCNLTQSISVILRKDKTKADLARFHHAALFSPVKSTLISALHNNHLTTWLGLDKKLINRHHGKILNAAKEHLDQERK